jgi:hypothetical protein
MAVIVRRFASDVSERGSNFILFSPLFFNNYSMLYLIYKRVKLHIKKIKGEKYSILMPNA